MTALLQANINNVVTAKEAKAKGLSKQQLQEFVARNELERVGHGLYAPADAWVDELYILHKRCPSAVFSHDEAFYYHDLVDREPMCHTITVYSGFNAHRLKASCNVKVYSVKKELLKVGKTTIIDDFGNKIPMYDLERSICDAFRSRNSIEAQDFNSILKSYVKRTDKNLNLLMEYAKLSG
jgi:predicted transcriptional regulator of viral defense system